MAQVENIDLWAGIFFSTLDSLAPAGLLLERILTFPEFIQKSLYISPDLPRDLPTDQCLQLLNRRRKLPVFVNVRALPLNRTGHSLHFIKRRDAGNSFQNSVLLHSYHPLFNSITLNYRFAGFRSNHFLQTFIN